MKFKIIILFLALIKLVVNSDCIDGSTCPGDQKCCATKDGFSCCPYSNGVCCLDMEHCCTNGYTCTSKGTCEKNN